MRQHLTAMFAVAALSAAAASETVGFKVESDRASAHYRCGEEAVLTVTATNGLGEAVQTGEVDWVIDNFTSEYGESGVVARGKWNFAEGNPRVFRGTLRKPDFLRLKFYGDLVRDLSAWTPKQYWWGVAFEPEKIQPGGPNPKNFDAFWARAMKKLEREVPLKPKMTRVAARSTKDYDFYRISFATVGGRRVHGFMSVPTDKSKAPYPVIFEVSSAGEGRWTMDMDRGLPDRIRVYFTVHNFEPPQTVEELREIHRKMSGEMKAKYGTGYDSYGMAWSREDYYFYDKILGINRAVNWVWDRPDVDRRNFGYVGGSQGGGFGLYLTGLNHHFTSAVLHVPALCDTLGYQGGHASGWPHLVEKTPADKKAAAAKNAPYFDGANFARRVTCPIRFSVGFVDTACNPASVYAAFNVCGSKDKKISDGVGLGHFGQTRVLDRVNDLWQRTHDEWRVTVADRPFDIAPPPVVEVKGERIADLKLKPEGGWTRKHGGWLRGTRLAALVACECSVCGALLPDSVVVKLADGTRLTAGKDYELEGDWAAIARLKGGLIGEETPVFVDYSYRAQRLDRIVRTAAGAVELRPGAPAATQPVLPPLAAGETALATVWVDGRTTRLSSRNVYFVREQAFPEAPAWGPSLARRCLPKTLGKLERGEPVKILAWGDSVTAGTFLPEADRWQHQFVRRLRAKYPQSEITLVSNGWGGKSSEAFLDEKLAPPGSEHNFRERVVGVKADLVVIEFVNDSGLAKYADFKKRYDHIRAELAAVGSEICRLTPHYVRGDWMNLPDPTMTCDDPRPYVRHMRYWCVRSGVACADASIRWGRLARQGLPYQTLLVNEINHPNAYGMSIFADALMDVFRGGEGPGPMREGRQLVWSDEFEGDRLDPSKWRFRRSMYGSDCVYSNDARTARVENGMLHLQVHKSGQPEKKFMLSQGVATHETMNWAHGYLEMRARVPFRHGAWPSFWMTSATNCRSVPWHSEIDIFEVFSSSNTVVANLHKWGHGHHVMLPGGEGYPARGYQLDAATVNDEFHVYGFEWNPREMVFYVDDKPYYRCPVDEAHDFNAKFIEGMAGCHDPHGIIFNNEIFTPGHGWCPKGHELTLDDPFPIDYWIDWVRLWQDPQCERIEYPLADGKGLKK